MEKEGLVTLFNRQMWHAEFAGVQEDVLAQWKQLREKVVEVAMEIGIPEGFIPFFPVVPGIAATAADLDGVNRDGIVNLFHVAFSEPYFVVCASEGLGKAGRSVIADYIKIEDFMRYYCLTADEVISMFKLSVIALKKLGFFAGASRFSHSDKVICLLNKRGDGFQIDWRHSIFAHKEGFGTPFCKGRIF